MKHTQNRDQRGTDRPTLRVATREPRESDERFILPQASACRGEAWAIRSIGPRNLLIAESEEAAPIAAIPAPGGAILAVSFGDGWMVLRGTLC